MSVVQVLTARKARVGCRSVHANIEVLPWLTKVNEDVKRVPPVLRQVVRERQDDVRLSTVGREEHTDTVADLHRVNVCGGCRRRRPEGRGCGDARGDDPFVHFPSRTRYPLTYRAGDGQGPHQ
jgi:hypothetical protein